MAEPLKWCCTLTCLSLTTNGLYFKHITIAIYFIIVTLLCTMPPAVYPLPQLEA
jgi:hypothetical protein